MTYPVDTDAPAERGRRIWNSNRYGMRSFGIAEARKGTGRALYDHLTVACNVSAERRRVSLWTRGPRGAIGAQFEMPSWMARDLACALLAMADAMDAPPVAADPETWEVPS